MTGNLEKFYDLATTTAGLGPFRLRRMAFRGGGVPVPRPAAGRTLLALALAAPSHPYIHHRLPPFFARAGEQRRTIISPHASIRQGVGGRAACAAGPGGHRVRVRVRGRGLRRPREARALEEQAAASSIRASQTRTRSLRTPAVPYSGVQNLRVAFRGL